MGKEDLKITNLRQKMTDAGIVSDRQAVFVEFEEQCGGRVGGYMLNLWMWGLLHEKTEWRTPNEIEAEYNEKEDLWSMTCFEGHPSDYWTIDEKGAIYWCGSKRADNYLEIVQNSHIDRDAQFSFANQLDVSIDTKKNILYQLATFNATHKLEISAESIRIITLYLGNS